MKTRYVLFVQMLLLLFLLPCSYVLPAQQEYGLGDSLFFASLPIEGKHYEVNVVFLNEKTIEVKTNLKDSSGVILQSRTMKAKLYPIKEHEALPVLFDADIFTAGYHCPVMIYLERLTRMQIYIDDAGCYAGEAVVPSFFGNMMRSK